MKRPSGRAVRTRPRRRPPNRRTVAEIAGLEVEEIESLRGELERVSARAQPPRWNANPDDVRKSVGKLVLTLVEFLRRLMERQAVRRMEAGGLSDTQAEDVGLALMRLERTIRELAESFGLDPDDLDLDLGPLGRLH